MHPALDKLLVEQHPLLYRDYTANIRNSAMPWGFCVGDGWFYLIWELSQKLETELQKMSESYKPCASQVKEKFGTLRFYMTAETNAMSKAIQHAETRSSKECEQCGQPGIVNGKFWLQCLCETCRQEKVK